MYFAPDFRSSWLCMVLVWVCHKRPRIKISASLMLAFEALFLSLEFLMAFKLLFVTSLSLNFPVYLTPRYVTQEIQHKPEYWVYFSCEDTAWNMVPHCMVLGICPIAIRMELLRLDLKFRLENTQKCLIRSRGRDFLFGWSVYFALWCVFTVLFVSSKLSMQSFKNPKCCQPC